MPLSHILLALSMAVVTSGFTSFVAHEITLLAPSFFTFAIIFINGSDNKSKIQPAWFFVPTLLIFLAMLSTNNADGKLTSLIHAMSMFIPFYALLLSSNKIHRIVELYALACATMILLWIGYLMTHVEEIKAWAFDGIGGSCNLLSAEINMLFPFLYLIWVRSKGPLKTFTMLLMAGSIVSVFLLMSRSGIAAMTVILISLFMFNHRKAALSICAALFCMVQFRPDMFHLDRVLDILRTFRFIEHQASAPRPVIWQVSWEALRETIWLGVGPGNADRALSIIDINHSHNNVVQIALEMGVVSAALILGITLYAMSLAGRLLVGNHRRLIAGLPVFSYIVYSITASPIQHPEITLLLVLTMNNALSHVTPGGRDEESIAPTHGRQSVHGMQWSLPSQPAHASAMTRQPGR